MPSASDHRKFERIAATISEQYPQCFSPHHHNLSKKMSGGGMESMARPTPPDVRGGGGGMNSQHGGERCGYGFHMPLHYPRYTRAEYEIMPEWKLDCLLTQYGLPINGDVNQKRKFAMGAFLWTY
ncbi:hypothetical protein RND71_040824 [Anisodus tanguticus]|uniref:DUF7722 domain-containing protein n=1 Tax=Anisodus tanguticus TaxID=243964 RepID=A0AAE1QWG7_9SOLA|nr:hypothetical protein RND71_040824 [Anisodus tanguticus]